MSMPTSQSSLCQDYIWTTKGILGVFYIHVPLSWPWWLLITPFGCIIFTHDWKGPADLSPQLQKPEPTCETMVARTPRTKELERFKEQFFQWHFIEKCSTKEVKRRFDLLFIALAKVWGKTYHVK